MGTANRQAISIAIRGLRVTLARVPLQPQIREFVYVSGVLALALCGLLTFVAAGVLITIGEPSQASAIGFSNIDGLGGSLLSIGATLVPCLLAVVGFVSLIKTPLTYKLAVLPWSALVAAVLVYAATGLFTADAGERDAITFALVAGLYCSAPIVLLCARFARNVASFAARSAKGLYTTGLESMSAQEQMAIHARSPKT